MSYLICLWIIILSVNQGLIISLTVDANIKAYAPDYYNVPCTSYTDEETCHEEQFCEWGKNIYEEDECEHTSLYFIRTPSIVLSAISLFSYLVTCCLFFTDPMEPYINYCGCLGQCSSDIICNLVLIIWYGYSVPNPKWGIYISAIIMSFAVPLIIFLIALIKPRCSPKQENSSTEMV